MKAEIKTLPQYRVAYVRKTGPYGPEICEKAFQELMAWAGPLGYLNAGVILGVYWDDPETTPPEKCRMDACVSVADDVQAGEPIGMQTIKGGQYAVGHFEIPTEGFQKAWEVIFNWLGDSEYEWCGDEPCYEHYHNDAAQHPDGKWIVDICIPVKPKA